MSKSNYHTHTCLCDGKNTIEEIVKKAIEMGCPEIGFSGHSFTSYDTSYCMSREGTREYIKTVLKAKEKYKDKIRVFLGLEHDYYADSLDYTYDYTIGSVHTVLKNGEYISVDETAEKQLEAVNKHYEGDFLTFVEDYYKIVGDVYRKTGCNIIGHFDVITKFNEGNRYFDTSCERYRRAALNAISQIAEDVRKYPLKINENTPDILKTVKFEINTGAVAKGYRTEAYPEPFLAEAIKSRGFQLIYSSDCHDKEKLLLGF